jgi:hypothetical protein
MSENLSRRRERNVASPEEYVDKRFSRLETAVAKVLATGPTTLHKIDIETYDTPAESEIAIDWPTQRLCWYHDGEWICVPMSPTHAIKVFPEKKFNKVDTDGAFRFDIERDLDGYHLFDVAAFNGTVGSGPTVVSILNITRGINLLTTNITIDGGKTNSYFSTAPQPVINMGGPTGNPNNKVNLGDTIWINVPTVGTGSKGLGVYMTFVLPIIT